MTEDKSQWILNLIGKLIDAKIGNPSRLSAIKFALEGGRPIYDSDQKYLDEKYEILMKQKPETYISTESVNMSTNVRKSESSGEDPLLSILKNRLAKGEITPEEFYNLKNRIIKNPSIEKLENEIRMLMLKLKKSKKSKQLAQRFNNMAKKKVLQ